MANLRWVGEVISVDYVDATSTVSRMFASCSHIIGATASISSVGRALLMNEQARKLDLQ